MMGNDKITVDDPLISTDVDKLIRTIAEKQSISLSELREICAIDKKTLDKWISVLEDEQYIKLEYNLGNTVIHWRGLKNNFAEPAAHSEPATPSYTEPTPTVSSTFSTYQSTEADSSTKPEPEQLLSQFVSMKNTEPNKPVEEIKSRIITNLKESQEDEPKTAPAEKEDIIPEPKQSQTRVPEPKQSKMVQQTRMLVKSVPMKTTSESLSMSRPAARDLISAYMDEINKEKAEIASLKAEKEEFYKQTLSTIEGKLSADLVAVTDAIIQKEAKITELKEHLLELPDKVEEVEKLHAQLDRIKKEGKEAIKAAKDSTLEFTATIRASKTELEDRTKKLKADMGEAATKFNELEELGSSANERMDKISSEIEKVTVQIHALDQTMDSLRAGLEETRAMKYGIKDLSEEISQTLSTHQSELESLSEQINSISNIEQWISEYLTDYESKMEEVVNYVSRSEDDLADLKEAAESAYMKKYLDELETLTASYQNELESSMEVEESIDEKIVSAKSRINELVRDSQEMIKKLKAESSEWKDFDSLKDMVQDRTSKIRRMVEEKGNERARLLGDAQKASEKAVSTPRPSPSRTYRSAKPKAKVQTRKNVSKTVVKKKMAKTTKKGRKR